MNNIINKLPEELRTKLINRCETADLKVYWGQSEPLDDDYLKKIFQGKFDEMYDEIEEMNYDSKNYIGNEFIDELVDEFKGEMSGFLGNEVDDNDDFEWEDDIKDWLRDFVSVDMDIDHLLSRSCARVRIEMLSNYDCINSHWFEAIQGGGYEYDESYFGAMVDVLMLNPKLVKEAFEKREISMLGEWPNIQDRNGFEYVDYDDFAEEMENNSGPASLLTFAGEINMKGVYDIPKMVVLTKGTNVGLWSTSDGAGSMVGLELIRPMVIDFTKPYGETKYDKFHIELDADGGYGIQQSCGCTSTFWDKEIIPTDGIVLNSEQTYAGNEYGDNPDRVILPISHAELVKIKHAIEVCKENDYNYISIESANPIFTDEFGHEVEWRSITDCFNVFKRGTVSFTTQHKHDASCEVEFDTSAIDKALEELD